MPKRHVSSRFGGTKEVMKTSIRTRRRESGITGGAWIGTMVLEKNGSHHGDLNWSWGLAAVACGKNIQPEDFPGRVGCPSVYIARGIYGCETKKGALNGGG